jgi:hypothetical protein
MNKDKYFENNYKKVLDYLSEEDRQMVLLYQNHMLNKAMESAKNRRLLIEKAGSMAIYFIWVFVIVFFVSVLVSGFIYGGLDIYFRDKHIIEMRDIKIEYEEKLEKANQERDLIRELCISAIEKNKD